MLCQTEKVSRPRVKNYHELNTYQILLAQPQRKKYIGTALGWLYFKTNVTSHSTVARRSTLAGPDTFAAVGRNGCTQGVGLLVEHVGQRAGLSPHLGRWRRRDVLHSEIMVTLVSTLLR